MMKTVRTLFLGVAVMIGMTTVGCAKAPTTVGQEKSSVLKGTQTLFQADTVTVTNTAKSVAEDLSLSIEKYMATGLDGKVIARSASRMKVAVTVKTAGNNASYVTVRAGGFGDRSIQKQFLDRMKAKLPETAYTPPAPPVQQANPPVATGQQPRMQQMVEQSPQGQSDQATTDSAQLPF